MGEFNPLAFLPHVLEAGIQDVFNTYLMSAGERAEAEGLRKMLRNKPDGLFWDGPSKVDLIRQVQGRWRSTTCALDLVVRVVRFAFMNADDTRQ